VDVRTLTCEELEELLPAYVLGALNPDETAAVARHMRGCGKHAESLDDYDAVVDGLSISVPQVDPPAHLRARLLASTATPRRVERRRAWLGWAVAGLAVVVAIVSGVWAVSLQSEKDEQIASRARLVELAGRPDAIMVPLSAPEGGASKGVLIYAGTDAAVWAVALPTLENNEVFECWWVGEDNDRVSGGAFRSVGGVGVWFIPAPMDAEEYHVLGITLEPKSGNSEPQGPQVLAGEF